MSSGKLLFERLAVALPAGVNAVMTTRKGGVSAEVYSSFNLADHVGDDLQSVKKNRVLLKAALALPAEPLWLRQVHSNRIANSGEADGSYSCKAGEVLCIQSADCLPILIWDKGGREIAAVHAGWQGLASGIIENAIRNFESADLTAWIGPHIRSCHYEVDIRLYDKFSRYPESLVQGEDAEHWQLSLARVASLQLSDAGVDQVLQSDSCTACDEERFFSYRRDGLCGRMATLIWMT